MQVALMERLGALGFYQESLDAFLREGLYSALDSALARGRAWLITELGTDEVPQQLHETLLDLATGFFLRDYCARLDQEGGALLRLTEGDVSLAYGAGSTSREQMCALWQALLHPGAGQLGAFRRIGF